MIKGVGLLFREWDYDQGGWGCYLGSGVVSDQGGGVVCLLKPSAHYSLPFPPRTLMDLASLQPPTQAHSHKMAKAFLVTIGHRLVVRMSLSCRPSEARLVGCSSGAAKPSICPVMIDL